MFFSREGRGYNTEDTGPARKAMRGVFPPDIQIELTAENSGNFFYSGTHELLKQMPNIKSQKDIGKLTITGPRLWLASKSQVTTNRGYSYEIYLGPITSSVDELFIDLQPTDQESNIIYGIELSTLLNAIPNIKKLTIRCAPITNKHEHTTYDLDLNMKEVLLPNLETIDIQLIVNNQEDIEKQEPLESILPQSVFSTILHGSKKLTEENIRVVNMIPERLHTPKPFCI